jgi:hypothetical protein
MTDAEKRIIHERVTERQGVVGRGLGKVSLRRWSLRES